MSNKFCVTLKHAHSNTDKATLAFVVANAAVGSDKETLLFLMSEGVVAAKRGEAAKINEGPPFAPLEELIGKYLAGGGKLYVCSPCMKKRDITESQLIEGAEPAGGAALVAWLSESAASVDF